VELLYSPVPRHGIGEAACVADLLPH
jgi:hypothetical protein